MHTISGSKHTVFFFLLQTNLCVRLPISKQVHMKHKRNYKDKFKLCLPNPQSESNNDDYDNDDGNISNSYTAHKQYALMFSHFTE